MIGKSSAFAEARVTVPRERGATRAARIVAYLKAVSVNDGRLRKYLLDNHPSAG